MATPLTPSKILTVLRGEGLTVREYPGWRDRCRCHTGSHEKNVGRNTRGWGEVNGFVQHITAGDLGKRTVEQYIAAAILGDPNIPCKVQFVTDPYGVVWLVSAGRCNHAGKVGSKVREHMGAADYSLTDDYDNRYQGLAVDGNTFTYGNECIAAKSMNAAQRASSVLLWAALGRALKWTGQETVGHGEVSGARGKGDPNLHMGQFRKDIMARIEAGKPTAPKPPVVQPPSPTRHTSSVLIQNCASKRSDAIVGGKWSKRVPILANVILDSDASFTVCPELYAAQRPALSKLIAHKYDLAAVRGGRVLYYRKGRWVTTAGSWWRNLLGTTKPCIVDTFTNLEDGGALTVSAWHTSYETNAAGSAKRRKEVKAGIQWIKGLRLGHGRNIFAGDFNSPADASTRIDDVEPVFEFYGYHDLEDDHEVQNGPGHYHLDRVFAGSGVKGERIEVVKHKGSDHPATYVEFSY